MPRSRLLLASALSLLSLSTGLVQAAPKAAPAQAKPLPASLTAEERAYLKNRYPEYLRSKLPRISPAKPRNLLAAPGEFESCEGVLFAWQGYTGLVKGLIKEVALKDTAFVVVRNGSEESSVASTLAAYGADMSHVKFVQARVNSIWMRDYGPWWIQTADGDREIVDLIYNRPRPADDAFPAAFGPKMNLKVNPTELILPGGNLILDGHGVAIMTDVVFDENQGGNSNMTLAQLEKYMADYFGCTKVIMLKAMHDDGTGHVDMFGKLLNDDTFIIGEYDKPSDGASGNKAILDANAAKLAAETNGLGVPFKVHRIPMPRYDGTSYTHTNSLIVNGTVMVPTYGGPTDDEALGIYRSLMPGAKVVGFDCNEIIGANGAIHCITKLVMSDPLTVDHAAPTLVAGAAGTLHATVTSLAPLAEGGVVLHWRTAGAADFQTTPMAAAAGSRTDFTAELPAQMAGDTIEYYIQADDSRGMHETSPEDASATVVHTVTVAPAVH